MPESTAPEVTAFSWGLVTVAGYDAPFKDVKLHPNGARAWDWSETGTQHVPGIQPTDVMDLLENGAQTVVLTKGVHERLQVCPETLEMLAEKGITVHVLQTEAAITLYNQLRQQEAVGILIHSTC